MVATRCIVRAYADEPLERFAVAFERKMVFVVSRAAVERGDLAGAIGFPEGNVFEYDAEFLKEAVAAYIIDGPESATIWSRAEPLRANLPRLERVW